MGCSTPFTRLDSDHRSTSSTTKTPPVQPRRRQRKRRQARASLSKTLEECSLLLFPVQRQLSLEMLCGQMVRLAPRENCLDDAWGEHHALQYPSHISALETRLPG